MTKITRKDLKYMSIRKSTTADLDDILHIYACAREQMKKNGNPTQWGDIHPLPEIITQDIENGNSYVIDEAGKICGVFAFIYGDDPTYQIIDGKWLNNKPYGAIHRIASNGSVKGILNQCLAFCEKQIDNIRIDTHEDNKIMQHLLSKNGYTRCGIISAAEDGTPRIAYQKCFPED